MQRSVSNSKWKDVLGFDDGSRPSASPPSYRYTPTPLHHLQQLQRSASLPALAQQERQLQEQQPSFPRAVAIARDRGSENGRDLCLRSCLAPKYGEGDGVREIAKQTSLRPTATIPLFHVGIFKEPQSDVITSRPEVMLHAGPGRGSRVVAFAKFHSVTESTDVTLCLGQYGNGATGTSSGRRRPGTSPSEVGFSKPGEVLGDEDVLRTPRYRCVKVERRGSWNWRARGVGFSCWVVRFGGGVGNEGRERFEWRNSKERKALEFRRTFGGVTGWTGMIGDGEMKLVCVRTKESVASFLNEDVGGNKNTEQLGVFRFLGGEEGLGEEFEVLAIMSLISLLERSRRKSSKEVKRGIFRDRCGFGGFYD